MPCKTPSASSASCAVSEKYHFIGIGGVGMSGLAKILLEKQLSVSGSDLSSNAETNQLTHLGAEITQGHAASNVSADTTVIWSSSISKSNPEYQAAEQIGCLLLHRSELLARLMAGYRALAVTGTHGKTTTSSLLSNLLLKAGWDPSFALGGILKGINTNSHLGKGPFFVAEADESDGSFLNYHPEGAILTNVEAEHLDYYKTESALHAAFQQFFTQVKNEELLFYCADDPLLSSLAAGRGFSYGFSEKSALRISNYQQEGWMSCFDLHFRGKTYSALQLALIGRHNALNAAAVFGMGLQLQIPEETLRTALSYFPGVARRADKKGERQGVLLIDDYAHHPTEISTTIRAIKSAIQSRRLVVLFQPHRYSRVQALLEEFARAFEGADQLYITDIYAASEAPIAGLSAETILERVKQQSRLPSAYLARERWVEELVEALQPHDVLLTCGAGDVTSLHSALLADKTPLKKLKVGLFFGGKSCEHEISLRSARFIAKSLDPSLYSLFFFGIDKAGRWLVGDEAERALFEKTVLDFPEATPLLAPEVTQALAQCDLFFPVLHGANGEDGTLQGFFELLDKPYVGPNHCAAAICMNKVLTKRLVEAVGVPTPQDLFFGYLDWTQHSEELLQKIMKTLPLPVYVKPVHLGSSIGITANVSHLEELRQAIDLAFLYDTEVLVEESKLQCRELEFAVIGNSQGFALAVPAPGEKLASGEFVDYEKKYGTAPVKTTISVDLSEELLAKGKKLAALAYTAVGCTGMTRVDFLLDTTGEFWLFEMNAIPGLQQLSLFPKIWAREGVDATQFCHRLIVLALEIHRKKSRHCPLNLLS